MNLYKHAVLMILTDCDLQLILKSHVNIVLILQHV